MPPVHIILIAVVAALCCLALFLKLLSKGSAGEFAVKLMFLFLNKEYHKFSDITIKDGEKTVQIDHIVVSKYGIFVIETKNYTGAIYGSDNSNKFIKYSHKKKYEFYSPIKQNKGHIYALSNVLGQYKYVSIVAFSGYAKLKVESQSFVGYIGDMIKYIKSFKEEAIPESEINNICKKIKEISIKGLKTKREHVKNVRKRVEEYDNAINNMICPKCGGNLILRKGQYGEFYGCSNYPKCKFKKSI